MDLFLRILGSLLSRKKLFWFLAAAFFTGLGISTVYRGCFEVPKRTDFTVYLAAAEAVNSGGDIYAAQNSRGWNYLYLPLLAVILSFFTKLPLPLLVFLWYALSLTALYGSVVLLAKMFPENKSALLTAVAAYTLTLPCFTHTLARGQVGVLVLFLLTAVFYFYLKREDFFAGMLLALAIVLKVSPPGFAVFFFLFKREWRVLWWTLAGAGLFTLIVPGWVLGRERTIEYLFEWLRLAAQSVSARPFESPVWHQATTPFAQDNQSLSALATRLFWGTESLYFQGSNEVIRLGTRILSGAVLAGLAFSLRSRRADGDKTRLLAQYALFPALMLLASPVSETHHYTVLFLLFAAALMLMEGGRPAQRVWLALAAWISFLFYLAGLLNRGAGWYGLPAAGLLVLFAVVWRIAADRTRALEAGQKDLGQAGF